MKFLDRRLTLRKHPAVLVLLALLVLALSAALTIVRSGSYLSIFWRISQASWRSPGAGFAMVGCPGVLSEYYRTGALYLDIDPRLAASLRDADVVVTGNSRTLNTFCLQDRDNQLDLYFRKKGLKFFLLAEDGSGFRYRMMILERLKVRPPIALINTEDLLADMLEDFNREVVFNEDRFRLPFLADHLAIEMQQAICSSPDGGPVMSRLKDFYCNGPSESSWRNLETGGFRYCADRPATKRQLIVRGPDTRIINLEVYRNRMKTMLASEAWSRSRVLFYEVPSPGMMVEVSRTLAHEARVPFVFPEVSADKQYYVNDGSHMEVDSSRRWTAEFLQALDPELTKLLKSR